MKREKKVLQTHEGKKGYWLTTKTGKPFFVEEEDYKRWALKSGLGLVAGVVGYLAGRKVGLFTKGAKVLSRVSEIIKDTWAARGVLGPLIRSNHHPGIPGFSHKVTEFSHIKKRGSGRFLVKTDMFFDGTKKGTFSFVLNPKKKQMIIKNLQLDDIKDWKAGLGKALRSPYDYAEQNGFEEIVLHVKRGKQSVEFPKHVGTTWLNAAVEKEVKEDALKAFETYLNKLPKNHRAQWTEKKPITYLKDDGTAATYLPPDAKSPADVVRKAINHATHPTDIISPRDLTIPASLRKIYEDEIGPQVMSKVKSWKGKMRIAGDPTEDYVTFNRLVGYSADEAKKGVLETVADTVKKTMTTPFETGPMSPFYQFGKRSENLSRVGVAQYNITTPSWTIKVTTKDGIVVETPESAAWARGKNIRDVVDELSPQYKEGLKVDPIGEARPIVKVYETKQSIQKDARGNYQVVEEGALKTEDTVAARALKNVEKIMKTPMRTKKGVGKGWYFRKADGTSYFLTEAQAKRMRDKLTERAKPKVTDYELEAAKDKAKKEFQKKRYGENRDKDAADAKILLDQQKEIKKEATQKKITMLGAHEEELQAARDYARDYLMEQGFFADELTIDREARKVLAAMEKRKIAEYMAERRNVVVSAHGSIELTDLQGKVKRIKFQTDDKVIPTYFLSLDELLPKNLNKAKGPIFRIDTFVRPQRNPKTGHVEGYLVRRIADANRNATELMEAFPPGREFLTIDEAVNYFTNWVGTSGVFGELAPVIRPGRGTMTVISQRNKGIRFAIRQLKQQDLPGGKTKGRGKNMATGKWKIEPIDKAKETYAAIADQTFDSREQAEQFLDQFMIKAGV